MNAVILDRIQQERDGWVARNFPGDAANQNSYLGVIEEVGELAHHFLKDQQGIRGSHEEHVEGMKDAIGDLMIYALGPCTYLGLSAGDLYDPTDGIRTSAWGAEELIAVLAGSGAQLLRQGRMGRVALAKDALRTLMRMAERFCELHGWDFEEVVVETWNRVSKRDWVSDPRAGGEPLPTTTRTYEDERSLD